MSAYLKGNFTVKRDVVDPAAKAEKSSAERIKDELRSKALSSLGGSMVYVDRTQLTWDGDAPGSDAPGHAKQ